MTSARARWPWLLAAAGYTGLAVAYTWPLALRMSSALPHDAFDPALNAWILWWNAHVVPLTSRWWNAPFFWPAPGALALSEHLLGISVLTTPLQWAGAGPVMAYNVAVLASFILSALAAHFLAWVVGSRHDAAVIAGIAYGFALYRLDQLPHLQVLWSFGMPLALASAHLYVRSGHKGWLVAFACAWLVQALSNGYYLLFFPLLLAAWLVWHMRQNARRSLVLAEVWAASSALLVPVLVEYRRVQTGMHLGRSINEIQAFSADLTAMFVAPADSVVWHRLAAIDRPEGAYFPGLAVLLLIAGGLVAGWCRRRPVGGEPAAVRRVRHALIAAGGIVGLIAVTAALFGPWRIGSPQRPLITVGRFDKPLTVALYLVGAGFLAGPRLRDLRRRQSPFGFYLLAAAALFVLAAGPRPRLNGTPFLFRAPYALLLALPGFGALRVPARLGMLVCLALSVAASLAFARLTNGAPAWRRYVLATATALLVAIESWPVFRLASPPPMALPLRSVPADGVVVELPLGATDRDVAAMFRSIDHRRPTINGYSGYDPPHYTVLKIALGRDDGGALEAVAAGRPLYVAVAHGPEIDRWSALVAQHGGATVASDDNEWRVFRLPSPDPPRRMSNTRLPIAALSANRVPQDIGAAADGDIMSLWNAGQLQKGNEVVDIDLGAERAVDGLRLELGPFVYDFPRALSVECQGGDEAFRPCWSGSTSALLIRGILADGARAPMDIPIFQRGVRRIRLRQTAVDMLNGWSIAELTVFGR